MGNSGSQTAEATSGGGSVGVGLGHQWTHSYPRTPHRLLNPHKVLPEAATPPRLRPTNNGEILYNGGTISGRQQQQHQLPLKAGSAGGNGRLVSRSSSATASAAAAAAAASRARHQATREHVQAQLKRYGSVPDLRDDRTGAVIVGAAQASRSPATRQPPTGGGRAITRKKYKAPPPPSSPSAAQHNDTSQDSWEMTSNGETSDGPTRRTRLFKTRAEMKRRQAPQATAGQAVGAAATRSPPKLLAEMQRSRSLPEFQAELQAATSRLRVKGQLRPQPQPPRHRSPQKQQPPQQPQPINRIEQPQQPIQQRTQQPPVAPAKTFYFGMEQAATGVGPPILDSTTSSEHEEADEEGDGPRYGIALNLRPILPKKQLEVPRFSPAAAWRQLAALEAERSNISNIEQEDTPTCTITATSEQRIAIVCSRDRWRQQQNQQEHHNTADDSGISGDGESPPSRNTQQVIGRHAPSWTPQQDLEGEDDSTSEEDVNNNNGKSAMPAKFSVRSGHVFSLSLPRENQLAAYMEEKARLVAAAGAATTPRTAPAASATTATATGEQSDNWFLSRSAPNSLNNGPTSLEHESGRLMYLPPWRGQRALPPSSRPALLQPPPAAQQLKQAKSCENLTETPSRPQDLQDPPQAAAGGEQRAVNARAGGRGSGKARRFTFQSTVRQIERRRLAERLSREAERKERQRLSELAAMQRVEEEFQRKRAREKATIRQQLRLYWMEADGEEECGEGADEEGGGGTRREMARPEPDGCAEAGGSACSDSPPLGQIGPPPRATMVLSEYRQPRRDYREWQGVGRTPPSPPPVGSSTAAAASTNTPATVHPKVVCDMPRVAPLHRHQHATNYRRNFAHGVRPRADCIANS